MSYWMAVRRRLAAAALAAIDIAALAIAYTGNMTDDIVTMGDGKEYRLLTLTSSGTLTIPTEVKADVWMCGGGANGNAAWSGGPTGGYGGSGGFIAQALRLAIKNITAVVGASAGSSSISGDISLSAKGASSPVIHSAVDLSIAYGASGGGGRGVYYGHSGNSYAGLKGTGETTYPFGDATYFVGKPHCAGGGGGACGSYYSSIDNIYYGNGGAGGSNGADGSPGTVGNSSGRGTAGSGAVLGGGNGAAVFYKSYVASTNASFYGSGGGGGAIDEWDDDTVYIRAAASGYQGVTYVRIPLNQKEAA